jgi:hydrogenase-1 operon protein HyaE
MNAAPVWAPPRSAMSNNFSGLVDKLVAKHGIADLDAAGFQAFMDGAGDGLVLLTEEPDTAAESWDMVVILPELLAALGGTRRTAVMRPQHARALLTRFGLGRLPALLFLRDGGYVGALEGLRDWSELVSESLEMQLKPVSRAPSIGIAVSAVSSSGCH